MIGLEAWYDVQGFIEKGGDVLFAILIATFFLWSLIIERYWYFYGRHRNVIAETLQAWENRTDHTSWHAHRVREMMISQVKEQTDVNIALIGTMVAVAPLLGLLGTVTGMIEVFDVMAATGSSSARAMASGVSKATIPTMAGMVAALSGVYFTAVLTRKAEVEVEKVADMMELK
ncbi:MAG: MotA/TolQ/ExbB proton channel family protein [Alphaproteobacteria bacterium]